MPCARTAAIGRCTVTSRTRAVHTQFALFVLFVAFVACLHPLVKETWVEA